MKMKTWLMVLFCMAMVARAEWKTNEQSRMVIYTACFTNTCATVVMGGTVQDKLNYARRLRAAGCLGAAMDLMIDAMEQWDRERARAWTNAWNEVKEVLKPSAGGK